MSRRGYTDEQLAQAIADSLSLRDVLNKLGLKEAGGNYKVLKRRIAEAKLDTSSLLGRAWRRGSVNPVVPGKSLEQLLVEDGSFQSFKLKRKLLAQDVMEHRCAHCRRRQWRGCPIPLELDHINGNSRDNRLENLALLCPNCHALTSTYRGKNIGRTVNARMAKGQPRRS